VGLGVYGRSPVSLSVRLSLSPSLSLSLSLPPSLSQTLLSEGRSPRAWTTSVNEGLSLRLGAQQRAISLEILEGQPSGTGSFSFMPCRPAGVKRERERETEKRRGEEGERLVNGRYTARLKMHAQKGAKPQVWKMKPMRKCLKSCIASNGLQGATPLEFFDSCSRSHRRDPRMQEMFRNISAIDCMCERGSGLG